MTIMMQIAKTKERLIANAARVRIFFFVIFSLIASWELVTSEVTDICID